MARAIFCIAQNWAQTEDIVDRLKMAGFANRDISVLIGDTTGTRDFAISNQTKAPEGAATGVGTGAVLGGSLGWLAGIGALAIPGVGALIAAGPIMAALSGAAVGGTIGGVAGALVGLGIPEFEAKRYEGKIKGGSALISVHSEDINETERAKSIFKAAGGDDISTTSESSNERQH